MIKKPYICNRFIEIMRVFAIITFIICSCIKTYADPSKFYLSGLEILMQEHGLANNTLLEIHQDKKGFLWLGTDVGVSRYDGIHFHNYNLVPHSKQNFWSSVTTTLQFGQCFSVSSFSPHSGQNLTPADI